MKKRMKKYKILIVFLLIIAAFIFNCSTVNAKEKPIDGCSADLNDECYAMIFGIDMVKWDTEKDEVTIRVAKDYKYDNGKNVVFKVKSINGDSVSKTYKVSYGKDVSVPVSLKNDSMIIELETTDGVTVKNDKETKTGKVTSTVKITKDEDGYSPERTDEDLGEDVTEPTITKDEIDCSKYKHDLDYYDDNLESFEQKFCYVREQARKNGEFYDGVGNTVKDKKFSMKCKNEAKKITILYTDKMTETEKKKYDAQYYQNRSYYFASYKKKHTLNEKYSYNYYPGANITGNKLSCTVKCQEAVIVEYGPPVGVKAGSCFQYKVKVTSRVSCNMEKAPEKPKRPGKLCTPAPTCYHGSSTYRQGGPSEEYDKCINECDGGKYTTKCSNKCYESVYGKEIDNNKLKKSAKKTAPTTKKACAEASEDGGCYYRNSPNGKIYWYGLGADEANSSQKSTWGQTGGGHMSFAPGRWYRYHSNWGKSGKTKYIVPLRDGFFRHNYGSDYCQDSCTWGGCDADEYINPGYARIDYDNNKEIYNKAVQECTALATCRTTLTTFEFATSYSRATDTNGGTEVINVHFPYSESTSRSLAIDKNNPTPDKLSTCKGATEDDKSYTDTSANATNPKSTILQFGGCYKQECPGKTSYMTEWSFPGTWVNRKTGEITFIPQNNPDVWRSKPDKFCVPRDANTVNALWYQWYYHQVEKIETPDYDSMCLTASARSIVSQSTYKGKEINYNILARTKKFGYYKWNFDIQCFYAIDNGDDKDVHIIDNSGDNKNRKCDPTQYRVRTVTTTELFPSGATTASGTTQGREAGYNWTDKASLENQDLPTSYKTSPTSTLSNIETKGNSIYSNSNEVDYHFKLLKSRNDIQKIRTYNSHLKSFDVYCGTITEKMASETSPIGISVYSSSLFRSNSIDPQQDSGCGSINANTIKANKLGTIGINNQ